MSKFLFSIIMTANFTTNIYAESVCENTQKSMTITIETKSESFTKAEKIHQDNASKVEKVLADKVNCDGNFNIATTYNKYECGNDPKDFVCKSSKTYFLFVTTYSIKPSAKKYSLLISSFGKLMDEGTVTGFTNSEYGQ